MEGNPNPSSSSSSNDHIGTVELARLLQESRRHAGSVLNAADMNPHLAACATCRGQFEELASFDRQLDIQLQSPRPVEPAPRHGDCPEAVVWLEIAAGPTPADETLARIKHASQCDHCGPLLHEAVAEFKDLNAKLTEAEQTHIAFLESARPEWQQRLAQRIAGASHSQPHHEPAPWWRLWMRVPRLAVTGVSLLAVVAVGSWVGIHQYQIRRNQPAAAAELLARAYTEKRTLELRIAGAGYAPLRVSRGPAASFTSRPEALLQAEALIATQIESHPTDPAWLQVKAQADVLDGRYDAAVEALHRALELEPHSPPLLIDLATAYSQRAQQEDRKDDFGAAYEFLSQALKLRPDDQVALFNRAIVAEDLFLYQQALDDWEHYLHVDLGSSWAEEARNRADAVRARLKDHQSHAGPLLAPAELVAKLTSGSRPSEADQRVVDQSIVDQRIEEYLHEAVRSWLPQAYPEKGAADPAAQRALFFLADLTNRQHGDHWLADFLSGSSAPHFPQGANALAHAIQANDTGDYDVSRQQAYLAEQLFRASGNTAGVLRAEFEQTFAAQIERRSEECRRRSLTGGAQSKRYAYPWVQIQLGLEESVCSALMGDLGTYEKAAQRAENLAQQAGYGALYLRAMGFVAEGKFETGDRSGNWKLVCAGLGRYWSGQFPSLRGYNLYLEGAFAAEAAGQSSLRLAMWREAVASIDSDKDLLQRAMAHSFMADAATAARLPQLAEQQYAEAARLFAAAPRTEASRDDALESKIRIARLQAHQGRFDDAIMRLTGIQDQVRDLSNNYLAQIFYSTLGEVQLRGHHEAEAEQAFRPALRLAEQSLVSLNSEASRVSWSRDAAPIYLGLAEAELLQGREQESLGVFEWYLGAPQRIGTRGVATSGRIPEPVQFLPDASQVPARLPLLSDRTVLAYGVLPDGLAIWGYDNRGINAKWIPKSPQELQDLAADFYAQCSDPGSELSALRRNSQSLYSLLIAPVEERLGLQRTLVIETEGILDQVPFEALLDSSDRYLIERVSIVHSLGPDSESRLRKGTAISSEFPALVVGSTASSAADGLIPLPDVAAEADAVASFFPSAHLLQGRQVTLSAIRSGLPGAAVFHFAGHALAAPGRTGLLLESSTGQAGAPRLMDATVVQQLRPQSLQLAVLSACSTASGSGGSSGFDSVTDSLLRAGVPHVVASRWAVDSVATRSFILDFYRNALSGQAVSDAIRMTSRKMLANPRTSHPYYWTAFAAYGRS